MRYCRAVADRKRTRAPDWEDVRVFAAFARHQGLAPAARALGVNHATVARRVAALERALGAPLVERRRDGYSLTARGHAVVAAAAAMEDAAERLERPEAEAPAHVRLTATPSLAEAFLLPRLPDLLRRHPGLDLDLLGDVRALSLARHEVDLALRLGQPERGELVARRVATVAMGFYATPEWAARLCAGEAPVFVDFDEANAARPEARFLARHFARARRAFRSNSVLAQAAAVRGGLGVGLLARYLATDPPDLVEVSLLPVPPPRGLFLVARPGFREVPAQAATADFLIALFRAEAARFAGS
jgi:DNA-binding transcriptional LysR family regulator